MEKENDIIKNWLELNERLENFILSKVHDKEIAKDILQEVFIRVEQNIGNLKSDDKFSSWIFQITRNIIVDHFRKVKKENYDDLTAVEDKENNCEQNEAEKTMQEFSKCVLPLILMLPEKYREVLLLTEIKGLSQKEVAKALNISYPATKSRVQRGREMLKEIVLKCCEIKTDVYGNVIDYRRKPFIYKFE
ncbi:RNA polymerase sigma factor SigZ [Marivirga sp. S37H4]|uniref:RNA polymerase sigma factor SigZ n=1 Tax=Marivirga aurantiaca TaxID=2802615 RepID=A0A934X041_9BACT|nr:RNA polymerase sigma factor SigZ [Marivirga aurantiaca]MBK6266209.1 RNA polymerase sigma factor SigZ [Marivirga aurantiaca]